MMTGESLKTLRLWGSVAHNNLMGEMATSHELPKWEKGSGELAVQLAICTLVICTDQILVTREEVMGTGPHL